MTKKFKIYMRKCRRCGTIFRGKTKTGKICISCRKDAWAIKERSMMEEMINEVQNVTFV